MLTPEIRENTSITVLYVDDEPKLSELVSLRLEQLDDRITVLTEQTASDGIELLRTRSIDCIISDYQMHQMDGLEFLKAVREEYPSLPFILYTGEGSEKIAEQAINAGVDAYVQKRFDSGQYSVLAKQIDTLVGKYDAERRLMGIDRDAHLDSTAERDEMSDTNPSNEPTASIQIIRAIAEQEGVDPATLKPPLYDVIDPATLDALVSSAIDRDVTQPTISFEYCGYSVTIDEETITLEATED